MKPAASATYTIAIADDHAILRAGLRKLIEEDATLRVAGEARDGDEILALLEQRPAELVIMDLSMPNKDGLVALEEIKRRWPAVKVMLLTMHNTREHFKQAIARGADGYILKDDVYESLHWAIKSIQAGNKAYSPKLADLMFEAYQQHGEDANPSLEVLTKREREVLVLIALGHTSKEIGDKLCISGRTVESHRASIMDKLAIRHVAGLVKFALQHGLI